MYILETSSDNPAIRRKLVHIAYLRLEMKIHKMCHFIICRSLFRVPSRSVVHNFLLCATFCQTKERVNHLSFALAVFMQLAFVFGAATRVHGYTKVWRGTQHQEEPELFKLRRIHDRKYSFFR